VFAYLTVYHMPKDLYWNCTRERRENSEDHRIPRLRSLGSMVRTSLYTLACTLVHFQ
jgi:hypothetical protein